MSDQLYVNGKVFTGRGEDDFASAFAVRDGRIAWVGSADDVDAASAVDLRGATVLPAGLRGQV